MESSKSSTATEIEKLKQKVIAYKNLLTTLKLGESLEDYVTMKGEFEELKRLMSQIDLLKHNEEAELSNEIEDNDVKQVSYQLNSLNQMVEELLSTLNKVTVEDVKEETTSSPKVNFVNNAKPLNLKEKKVITEPSYNQLRKLAGKVIYQNKEEATKPVEQKGGPQLDLQLQHRFFNKDYFQSIQNQSNELYQSIQMKTSTKLHQLDELPQRISGTPYGAVSTSRMPHSSGFQGFPIISHKKTPRIKQIKKNEQVIKSSSQANNIQQTTQPPTLKEQEKAPIENIPLDTFAVPEVQFAATVQKDEIQINSHQQTEPSIQTEQVVEPVTIIEDSQAETPVMPEESIAVVIEPKEVESNQQTESIIQKEQETQPVSVKEDYQSELLVMPEESIVATTEQEVINVESNPQIELTIQKEPETEPVFIEEDIQSESLVLPENNLTTKIEQEVGLISNEQSELQIQHDVEFETTIEEQQPETPEDSLTTIEQQETPFETIDSPEENAGTTSLQEENSYQQTEQSSESAILENQVEEIIPQIDTSEQQLESVNETEESNSNTGEKKKTWTDSLFNFFRK